MNNDTWVITKLDNGNIAYFQCSNCRHLFWRSVAAPPTESVDEYGFDCIAPRMIDEDTMVIRCSRCTAQMVIRLDDEKVVCAEGLVGLTGYQYESFESAFVRKRDNARADNSHFKVPNPLQWIAPTYNDVYRLCHKYGDDESKSGTRGIDRAKSLEWHFWKCVNATLVRAMDRDIEPEWRFRSIWHEYCERLIANRECRAEDLERIDVDRLLSYIKRAILEIEGQGIMMPESFTQLTK